VNAANPVTSLSVGTSYTTFTYNFTATVNGTYMVLFHDFSNTAFTLYVDDLRIYYTDQKAVVNCAADDGYRFGYQNMPKENEIYGEGNAYDFGARLYDPRLGRWFKCDPLAMEAPEMSPYAFVRNSPLIHVDPDGKKDIYYLTIIDANGQETQLKISVSGRVEVRDYIDGITMIGGYPRKQWGVYDVEHRITIDYSSGTRKTTYYGSSYSLVEGSFYTELDAKASDNYKKGMGTFKNRIQIGGLSLQSKEGGADPTKFYSLTDPEIIYNADKLIELIGGMKGDNPSAPKGKLETLLYVIEGVKNIKEGGDNVTEEVVPSSAVIEVTYPMKGVSGTYYPHTYDTIDLEDVKETDQVIDTIPK
jgi:RHS repeat-associated protein